MTVTSHLWICHACNFIYDESVGDPESGIAPGTPLSQLPAGWSCPSCEAPAEEFEPAKTLLDAER